MARLARNSKLDTRSARAKLAHNKGGYWQPLTKGRALGYRKGPKGGRWLMRVIDENGRHEEALGDADDFLDADGVTIFDYAQAQEKARAWFGIATRRLHGEHVGRGAYTVADAMADYMEHYRAEGKRESNTRSTINAHILPTLGTLEVAKLTSQRLTKWHRDLADAPAMLRSNASLPKKNTRHLNEGDTEAKRQRKASANRTLTVLKAALNHAWHSGRAADDTAWRKTTPFKQVDAPVIRYITEKECKRLVNACAPDFRPLVEGALHTGCRYGELTSLKVTDYNPDAGTVLVRTSKGGKPRHVTLTEEGQRFFSRAVAGKAGSALIFTRADGDAWGKSHQSRPLADACLAANIAPAVSFHVLRHTHGSLLAMRGVPIPVIAKQLGHADTRMTEKHYAHLCPNYVADTIRQHFPKLGLATDTKVLPLAK